MEDLTPQSPPVVFVLPEEGVFFVGDRMRSDGKGFLYLHGGMAVTLLGAGSGSAMDAQQLGRFFSVSESNLTLSNLHLVNGLAVCSFRTAQGLLPAHVPPSQPLLVTVSWA